MRCTRKRELDLGRGKEGVCACTWAHRIRLNLYPPKAQLWSRRWTCKKRIKYSMVNAVLKGNLGGYSNAVEQASFHLPGDQGRWTCWKKGFLKHLLKDVWE